MRLSSPPPLFWEQFVEWHLHATPDLARRLWSAFTPYCDTTVLWQLMLCGDAPTVERIARATDLIRPRDLLAASETLTEPGKLRRREIIQFQKRLLDCLDATGKWR